MLQLATGSPPETSITAGMDSVTTPATRNIELHVAGDVTGQLAVGDNNVQVFADHGSVVHVYQGRPIVPVRRPPPVVLAPRPFPGLLGRATEVAAARATLRAAQPFEYYAQAGWGKTALLRYLGQLAGGGYPDGVVYQPSDGQPLGDLLQFLFDAFYQTDVPFKPTAGQLRQYLQPLRALVILDDLDLDRCQLDALLTAMPQSVFLLASRERTLWGSGQAEAVGGLAKEAGLELFERELGRLLTSAEQPAFERLWSSLAGNPLGLTEAAALVREKAHAVQGLVPLEPEKPGAISLTGDLVRATGPDERKVLGLLASLYDAALPADHVAAITGVAGAAAILEDLSRQGLTEMRETGYRLKKEPASAVVEMLAPRQWVGPAISHFGNWAARFAGQPRLILEVADVLLKVLVLATETQQHWSEVAQLVRAVERPLAQAARWEVWQQVLTAGRQAAQALGDRAAEAWMLHQLGTRSLCLGEHEAARTFLNQAAGIREDLGDSEGAAVTRHNLERIAPPGGAPPPPPKPPSTPLLPGSLLKIFRLLVPMLVLGTAGWFVVPTVVQAVSGSQIAFESPNPTPGGVTVGGGIVAPSVVSHPSPTAVTSLAPKVVLPPTLDFGTQVAGIAGAPREVSVRNQGSGPLSIGRIAVTGDFNIASKCPTGGQPVAAGQSCLIEVQFNPAAAGRRTGALTVTDTSGTNTVALTGIGILTFSLSPSSLEFGKVLVGSSRAQAVTVTNTSGLPLLLSRFETSTKDFIAATPAAGVAAPIGPGPSCLDGAPVAPQASCIVPVQFSPQVAGARADRLVVIATSGDQQQASLAGFGVVLKISINPPALDFGTQVVGLAGTPREVILRNDGTDVIPIATMSVTGDFSFRSTCPSGGQALAPAQACTVAVQFSPAAAGLRTGTLSISALGTQTVALSGTGNQPVPLLPSAVVSPSAVDWVKDPKTPNPVTLTLTNQGNASLTVKGAQLTPGSDPAFAIVKDGCTGQTIVPQNACDVAVAFTPANGTAVSNDFQGSVQFVDNTPNSPQQVTLHGQGTPGAVPNPSAVDWVKDPKTPNSVSITLTNKGDGILLIKGVQLTSNSKAFALTRDGCSRQQLRAGSTCSVEVTLLLRSTGDYLGTVEFYDNAPGSPQGVSLHA